MQEVNFVKPGYEVMKLPSNGLNRDNIVEIQVRPMTMKEEMILTNKTIVKSGTIFDEIFKACIGKGKNKAGDEVDVDIDKLMAEDEYAILLFIRAISYGRKLETNVHCPTCDAKFQISVDLETDVPVDYAPEDMKNSISVKLPVSGKTVKLRYAEKGDTKGTIHEIIPRLITEVEGVDKPFVNTWLETIVAGDFAELRKAANDTPFGIKKSIVLVCTNNDCAAVGEDQEVDLPITADFFRL